MGEDARKVLAVAVSIPRESHRYQPNREAEASSTWMLILSQAYLSASPL